MAKVFYDQDVNWDVMKGKKVAIIGYGSQGHAHALNLKDSGIDVVVGLYEGSKSIAKAQAAGLEVKSVPEAVKEADITMILIPDEKQADVYATEIAPNLKSGRPSPLHTASTFTSNRSSRRLMSTYSWSLRKARAISSVVHS